jgi:aryl-alcohol dehydrogenase-like predicted oxidoreductase
MWSAANINEAVGIADAMHDYRPVTEQPLYNMLDRKQVEGEVEAAAAQNGIGLVVWSPLAQGLLTGKYNNGIPEDSRAGQLNWEKDRQLTEERIDKVRKLTAFANDMGISMATLALAWALKNPVVSSVITGASRPEQVEQNLKALDVKITHEIDEQIEAILDNKPELTKHN